MMNWVHLTQHFRVSSTSHIFEQCDLLMEALMESEDEHVFDAAISADAEHGVVIVEVTASGLDNVEAERKAVDRVRWALEEKVGVPVMGELPAERRVEQLALV